MMQIAAWSETHQSFEGSDRVFRDALSRFATGVTIITTDSADGPVGMTANSFASISMDPPLIMWAPAKTARRFPYFDAAENIAVHVLASDQQDLCWAFSKSQDAFEMAQWDRNAQGTPLIDGCLARFECEKYAQHDGGDHVIVLLKVVNLSFREGDPLVFYGGTTGEFRTTD